MPSPESAAVTVPTLEGLDLSDAQEELGRIGLSGYRADSEYRSGTSEGEVLWQEPTEGASVERGTEVGLTISLGPPPYPTIPDVTGMRLSEAEREIRAQGFSVNHRYEYSDRYASDVVASQSPPSGHRTQPGSTVHLVVSKGPQPQPRERDLILGSWQRTHQDGHTAQTGTFTFRADGTAHYSEASGKSEDHRWSISYDNGKPVLYFPSSGNSYYIERLDGSTMKWRRKSSDQKLHTTTFKRR